MSSSPEALQDLTEEMTFTEPSREAIDVLLTKGVVVVDGVVPDDDMEGVREAVDLLYFESLPQRLLYRLLESAPTASIRHGAHMAHSRLSQFNPRRVPERLQSASPAIEKVMKLDDRFFEDDRIQYLYPNRQGLNIADVSRTRPRQKAFIKHQDSINVTELGHIVQPVDTLWTIHQQHGVVWGTEAFTFLARMGSVVTTVERTGERPTGLPPGQGFDYYVADGSVVHSGDKVTDSIRHRLGLFTEGYTEDTLYERIRTRITQALAERAQ